MVILKLGLFVVASLGIPLWLDKNKEKYKIIQSLSVVVLCYALGLIIGNLFYQDMSHKSLATPLFEACVILSIPLLLIQSKILNFLKESKQVIFSFFISLFSVLLVTVLTFFAYNGKIENFWQICGMLVGVYTGGTPNMSAIALALNVDPNLFIKVNAIDLLGGGLMIFLILSVFVPLGMKYLIKGNNQKKQEQNVPENLENEVNSQPEKDMKNRILNLGMFFLISVFIVGFSAGLSYLIFYELHFIFLICCSSFLGIALSFHQTLSEKKESFLLGQYLLYVFCFTMGSLANLNQLLQSVDLLFVVISIVLFGSLFVHLFVCTLFRIPFETAIITATACIFGPPFVGPVAERLNNQNLLIAGITTGLFGYSIGTFLGVTLAFVLKNLG